MWITNVTSLSHPVWPVSCFSSKDFWLGTWTHWRCFHVHTTKKNISSIKKWNYFSTIVLFVCSFFLFISPKYLEQLWICRFTFFSRDQLRHGLQCIHGKQKKDVTIFLFPPFVDRISGFRLLLLVDHFAVFFSDNSSGLISFFSSWQSFEQPSDTRKILWLLFFSVWRAH